MTKKYVVVHDRQGGSFGMGRIYARKEWAEQAFEWSDTDGAFETDDEANDYQQMLTEMTEQEVIDYIADMWELDFAEHFEYCGKNFAFNVVADNNGEYPFLATVYQLDDDEMPHEVWNDYYMTAEDAEKETKDTFIESIKEGITKLRKETD